MIRKRTFPVLLLVLAMSAVTAFRVLEAGKLPPSRYEKILHKVVLIVNELHYSPKQIDDRFSKEIFTRYLGEVDLEKDVLLQSDVEVLRSQYETRIDDEILGTEAIGFVPAAGDIFKKRLAETEQIYKDLLARPFDFTLNEVIDQNYDKTGFPENEGERREVWRKRLKYLTLEKYAGLLELQESSRNKPGFVRRSEEDLETDARGMALKVMDRYYDRLKVKMKDDERFNMFVETIAQTMDPHTDYFPPVEKRSFDEQMSGHFFGIGATLRDDDGKIRIGTLVSGSPAARSGQVNVGDIIMKVAQGGQEPVDLAGYLLQDAVKLIRGAKGTEVRLTLKKTDGSTRIISLIRDEIVQDETTFARSAVVVSEKGKIGYIFLPEFYADFSNPKGIHCSEDVTREVIKLKEQKVDAIVIDLRHNPGGSLMDVVQMVGLFVEQGPVVQVKDRDGSPRILPAREKSVLYEGPLAVMVDELSASAAEIFAAAIQDYKRGVIIGSTSTYGKGTVQRPFPLDNPAGSTNGESGLGAIKLTLEKFYRISGGSTQLRGVSSDVVLPNLFEYYKIREKDSPDALPWDEIPKADYTTWKYAYDLNIIKGLSGQRLKNNAAFALIHSNAQWLGSKESDKVTSLNLKKYQEEQLQLRATIRQVETLSKLSAANELDVQALPQDLHKYDTDKGKADRFRQWLKGERTDIYLGEAVNVLNDMITQKKLVYNNIR